VLQVGATGINKIDYIFVQCRAIHLGSRQIQYPLTVQISCSFAMMEESIVVLINLFIVPSAESACSIFIVFFYNLPSTLMHTLIVSFRRGSFQGNLASLSWDARITVLLLRLPPTSAMPCTQIKELRYCLSSVFFDIMQSSPLKVSLRFGEHVSSIFTAKE
jgi:hypothetical protein